MSTADPLGAARRSLASARHLLAGDFPEKAGREAYLAGHQAALVLIRARTGRRPKTHSGTRSEFNRLAQHDPRIERRSVSFLGWAYELKTNADYGDDQPIGTAEAERAIAEATRFVDAVAALLEAPP